jgi:hypothetical protein
VAGLVALLILLTILTGPSAPFVGRAFLLYLSIVPAAAMLYGAYLHMQEEGGAPASLGRPGPPSGQARPSAPGSSTGPGTGTTGSTGTPGSTRPGGPPPPPSG